MSPRKKSPSSEVCPRCVKIVSDRGIGCDGKCQRWFHPECVNMSKPEYSSYSNDVNKKWFCERADCTEDSSNGLATLNANVSEILLRLNNLATKDEFHNEIKDVKDRIDAISAKIADLEPRISNAELQIQGLQTSVDEISKKVVTKPVSAFEFESFAAELNDREYRSSNVIFFNVPESTSRNNADRKNHDRMKVVSVLSAANLSENDLKTFYRLGNQSKNNKRPIKVVLTNKELAVKILKELDMKVLSGVDPSLAELSLTRDRTPNEIKHLKDLRTELAHRTQNGEKDLTIKYVNGVPKIINAKN
jgi:hypothetical protein